MTPDTLLDLGPAPRVLYLCDDAAAIGSSPPALNPVYGKRASRPS